MATRQPVKQTPLSPHTKILLLLKQSGMTQNELARLMGVSRYTVNQLCNNRRSITARMAILLARVFTQKAKYWMNLQRDIDLHMAMMLLRIENR